MPLALGQRRGCLTDVSTGRYVSSEVDVRRVPFGYTRDGTLRGVIYCHAASQTAVSTINAALPNQVRLWDEIGSVLPLVACDLGAGAGTTSTDSWGNSNAQTRVGQAKTWLQSANGGGAKSGTVLMIAVSMGNSVMVNYAKNNPTNVAAMVGILPVSDLDDIRNNDRSGLRASIDSAWGVTYPTALPAGASPATSNSGAVGIPYLTYYTSDDPVVIPATVTALTSAIGGTAVNMGTGGHSDAAIASVPIGTVVDFLLSHA